jgi:hypothetical protein
MNNMNQYQVNSRKGGEMSEKDKGDKTLKWFVLSTKNLRKSENSVKMNGKRGKRQMRWNDSIT